MYRSLSEYIISLEDAGELIRISVLVDPVEEIAEITDRESKKPGGGKALLFENTGTGFPVVTNMMGSDRRIAMVLGVTNLDELTARIDGMLGKALSPKQSVSDKLGMLPLLGEMSRWLPKRKRGRGKCQQVILKGDKVDLGELPILKCWPHDGGRFVTLPLVHTLDPDTGNRNVGMYRMQVFDHNSTGMHWHAHKTGERHYRRYKELGQRMPVSVCLGGDPAYTYSATAPMPDNMDEYLLAGFIRRKPVKLVKCITNDIMVPADCDFVIEGYVDPREEKVTEGPFGDHTGFYSLEDKYPVFHVTAITHRRDAVYPATVVGVPPQEDFYIGKATEKIFLAPIRMAILPEIRDMYLPAEGVAHNLTVVNINKTYEGQALKTANSLWGAGQMMFNKFLVVASTEENIRCPEVLRRLVAGININDDIFIGRGPMDVLDHSSEVPGIGGKMMIDTTRVNNGEYIRTPTGSCRKPKVWKTTGEITVVDDSLLESWRTVIVKCPREAKPDIRQLFESNPAEGVKFVVVMDETVDTSRHGDVLWLIGGNVDPARDIKVENEKLVIDARVKPVGSNGFARRWPNVVASSPKTIVLVDSRRKEYGIKDMQCSPSLRYIPLAAGNSAEYEKTVTYEKGK